MSPGPSRVSANPAKQLTPTLALACSITSCTVHAGTVLTHLVKVDELCNAHSDVKIRVIWEDPPLQQPQRYHKDTVQPACSCAGIV